MKENTSWKWFISSVQNNMKPTLSVVISAYNEEKSLERCLKSVTDLADEVVVVDNESQDKTVEVAKKYTKKIYSSPNQLMLNLNKNTGFEKASGDWILNLDADEEVTPALAKEILSVIRSNPSQNGFWLKRKNFSFGKWIQHGLWWPDKQIRLFRRGFGKFPCIHIHEYIKVAGEAGELVEPYIHYNYETVHQYLIKIDRASTSEALTLSELNYQLVWYDAIRFPVSDFIKIYFAQGGYKDGLHGLVLSLFQSFYSFCTFAKFWEMKKFETQDIQLASVSSELRQRKKEIQYWTLTSMINQSSSLVTKLWLKIQRKLVSICA
ncbi:glycosyltransferase family 2 protein [Patescibacteria group bacterium]|nr:glycosyltransferase family 2 protein [Patescibacteria group bacterium]